MTDDRQLEALLSDGLAAEARPVMADSRLTERIIAAASTGTATDGYATNGYASDSVAADSRLWQNWLMPAVAAALVALLIGSVLVGTKLLHSSSAPPGTRLTPTPALTAPVSPTPPAPHSTAPAGPSSSTPSTGAASSAQVGGPVPTGFSGYDLTWISADEGWALGTAPCSTAPCTSIVHTTDGGQSWVGLPAPIAYLEQTDTCSADCAQVRGIRFVSSHVGYVYGPNSFWMTTDGGASWQAQPGNALGVELAGAMVVRVSSTQPNCAPGCTYQVQRAEPGTADWQTIPLPSGAQEDSASLSASGDNVLLTTAGNPAGGASNAQSVLFSSTDAGASWQKLGEPCPQSGHESDTVAATVTRDGTIAALCQPRIGSASPFLAVSPGAGQNFVATPSDGDTLADQVSAVSGHSIFVGGTHLNRWDGSSWHQVDGPSKVRFVGFESDTVGRVLADNGLWATVDGGQTWIQLSYS